MAQRKRNARKRDKEKTCFFVCPIGEAGSATRKRSDQVQKYIVNPAAEECGYAQPIRADQLPNPGIITAQIIELLMESDLVIADLTDHNANVFYELAVRHVVRKPVVQLIAAGFKIPFDVSGMRTIQYNLADPDDLLEARAALTKHIPAAEANPMDADNPITSTIELKALRDSADPADNLNAEVLTAVRRMAEDIAQLKALTSFSSPHILHGSYEFGTPISEAVNLRNLGSLGSSLLTAQHLTPGGELNVLTTGASLRPRAYGGEEKKQDDQDVIDSGVIKAKRRRRSRRRVPGR